MDKPVMKWPNELSIDDETKTVGDFLRVCCNLGHNIAVGKCKENFAAYQTALKEYWTVERIGEVLYKAFIKDLPEDERYKYIPEEWERHSMAIRKEIFGDNP